MLQVQNVPPRLEFLTSSLILLNIDCYANIDSLNPHLPLQILKLLKHFYCASKRFQRKKFSSSLKVNYSDPSNAPLNSLFKLVNDILPGESFCVSLNYGILFEKVPTVSWFNLPYLESFSSRYCIPCCISRCQNKPNLKKLFHYRTNIKADIFPSFRNKFECIEELVCFACQSVLFESSPIIKPSSPWMEVKKIRNQQNPPNHY